MHVIVLIDNILEFKNMKILRKKNAKIVNLSAIYKCEIVCVSYVYSLIEIINQ